MVLFLTYGETISKVIRFVGGSPPDKALSLQGE